jgi:hypothetical protein
MTMAKKIGESESIRIYGPYPDKSDRTKWTVHIWRPGAKKADIIPTSAFDLSPLHDYLNKELFRSLIERARAQGDDK